MVRVQKLTAETLLSDPRRGPAVPNSMGTHVLYTLSTHKIDDKTLQEVRVMNIATRRSIQISADDKVHDALWIPGTAHDIVYLRSADNGRTQVLVASGKELVQAHYVAAEFDAPVSNLKLKALDDGSVVFVVTGLVDRDGSLYNEVTANNKSSARVYDTSNIRMLNELYKPQRYSLWYNTLVLHDDKWSIVGELCNLVEDITLEAPWGMYSGDALNGFDICRAGIAFSVRSLKKQMPDAILNAPVYFAPLESFTMPPSQAPKPISMPPDNELYISSNVRFTPDASTIGFLDSTINDPYNMRLFLASVLDLDAFDAFSLVTNTEDGSRDPPSAFEFAGSSDAVILLSQQLGRWALSHLKLQDREHPTTFFTGGASKFYPLVDGDWDTLLTTSSSFLDSSLWQIVNIPSATVTTTISSWTKNGAKFGLSSDMVSDFWYEGADGYCIHCWMIRPSDFDETRQYPWVLRPHGGPISAWNNEWMTSANIAAWAEQGYIVFLPNITGSTGYGLDFTRRIDGQPGGKSCQDLLNLVKYVEDMPFLDQEKAIFMSGSYAGYLFKWFLSHEVIKKFCCAVCHDGIFNQPSSILQSDLIFRGRDAHKSPYPWVSYEPATEGWNPVPPQQSWNWKDAPPTLVIHNQKDYCCPVTEGQATFNALQALAIPSRFLTFPDEGHVVAGPENVLAWHDVVWDWVRRCVDGDLMRGVFEW